MPWPSKVLERFQGVPPNPCENEFHGPYNKLLYTLFRVDSNFNVDPRFTEPRFWESGDGLFAYEVRLEGKPLFIVQLKAPGDIELASARQKADTQIRSRMAEVAMTCPLPTLHGVSAMGTRLCFYRLDIPAKGENAIILPLPIPRKYLSSTDTAPAERWDCDILEEDGEAKFRAVVDEIQQRCAQLNPSGD
ncbi:hypothetical protein EW146_g4845 [Bondarzewia mesenterica]|uniref:Uncharacterized protein n=1 Tax=Bondarzewia mesenterica TaxID=1095465 RepID=A0A4S4LTB8_9AGAM|nr:hypothetical protein EW146_g4845 [Bondarzewia mesenterica]